MSRSSRRLVTALAAATVATTLAACGGSSGAGGSNSGANEASDTGITADSIKIGSHYPLTGVAAPGYSSIPLGAQAYFDYVNNNGGVNGRKIDWVYKDDAYNPTQTSSVVNQLVLKDQVFAIMGGLGTPTHSAVVDFLNSEGVPDLFVASGSRLWGNDPKKNPETFGWQTDYESEGRSSGTYIKEKFPNAKVGLFLQDDDFGEDGEKGVRASTWTTSRSSTPSGTRPATSNVGPQIAGAEGAGCRLRRRLQRAGLHRAHPADRADAGLQAAVVLLQRRFGPDTGRRPAEQLLQGQGGRRQPARRRAHHRLPADRRPAGRPVDPAVPEGLGRQRPGRAR